MRTTNAALLLAICTSPCVAQVFVVDTNNGPGTHFTSIATAVAAVPDGAVLRVRAGLYAGFAIQAKSLAVLGESGVVVRDLFQQPITVSGLTTGQSVTLRHLAWSNVLGPGGLVCQNCAGTVLIEECTADAANSVTGGYVQAIACDRLLLRETVLQPLANGVSALQADRSNAVLVGCTLEGTGYALVQNGGRVQVTACSIVGGSFGQPVVTVTGGELVLHGSTRVDGGPLGGTGFAIDGTGSVTLDPNTAFRNVGNPPLGTGLSVTTRPIPRLDAMTGPLGTLAVAVLTVPRGSVGVLLVGAVTTPYRVAGLADPIWLAPGAVLQAIGGSPTTIGGYVVPNAVSLLGLQVGWQGVVLDASGGFGVSNAAVYAHD